MARKRPSRRAAKRPATKAGMKFCFCHTIALIGFLLIVAKATDYLTGCGGVPTYVGALGLIIAIVGICMKKKCNCDCCK